MKRFEVESWYDTYNYAITEVIADSEDAAIAYAQYLEVAGDLDYQCGDATDNGTEVIGTVDVKQEVIDNIMAKDKNGNVLQKGDRVRFSNIPNDNPMERDIIYIVDRGEEVYVGVKDPNDEFIFLGSDEIEKVVMVSGLPDRDYWLQHGDCPKCRLGNTVKPQAGEFVCNKCGWKH
jgi:hypothetical protein